MPLCATDISRRERKKMLHVLSLQAFPRHACNILAFQTLHSNQHNSNANQFVCLDLENNWFQPTMYFPLLSWTLPKMRQRRFTKGHFFKFKLFDKSCPISMKFAHTKHKYSYLLPADVHFWRDRSILEPT